MIPESLSPFIRQMQMHGVGFAPANNLTPPPYLKKLEDPDKLKPLLLRIKEDNADKTAVMVFLEGDKQPLVDYLERLELYSKYNNPAFANGNPDAGYPPLAVRIAGIKDPNFIPDKKEKTVIIPPVLPAPEPKDKSKVSTVPDR